MTATFEFEIDQTVTTPFGKQGIVTLAAVDGEGNQYYVKTENGGEWFKEKQLNPGE